MAILKDPGNNILHHINRILGNIAPISPKVKNFALCMFIVLFTGIMGFLAYQKEFDKVTALAGILIGLVSSQIFSVRAELEKQKQISSLEQKYLIYQELSYQINRYVAPIKTISLGITKDIQKNINEFMKAEQSFSHMYAKNSFLFSSIVRKKIHDLVILLLKLQLTVDMSVNKDFLEKVNEVEKLEEDIINTAREELGLN